MENDTGSPAVDPDNEQFYRMVTGNSSDAAVSVDAEQRILSANPAVADLFGIEIESIAGEAAARLLAESSVASFVDKLAEHLSTAGGPDPAPRERFSAALLEELLEANIWVWQLWRCTIPRRIRGQEKRICL